jgi:L-fuculose-phosphate aldolase
MNPLPYAGEREQLVAACHHLAAAGLSPGASGNLSMLADDGLMLTTPTGSALRRLTVETIVGIAPDGAVVFGAGPSKAGPSKEVPLHRAAYRSRPEARTAVHLHSPHATAVSCLPPGADGRAALPPLTPYQGMRLGAVPLVPYARPGTDELAELVGQAATGAHVLLLANHGSLTLDATLDAAVDLAEELETAAHLTLLTAGRGPRLLEP